MAIFTKHVNIRDALHSSNTAVDSKEFLWEILLGFFTVLRMFAVFAVFASASSNGNSVSI